MTARTLADQLRPTPTTAPARLNWTLTPPTGPVRRGEEVVTESEWEFICKSLAEARARHIK